MMFFVLLNYNIFQNLKYYIRLNINQRSNNFYPNQTFLALIKYQKTNESKNMLEFNNKLYETLLSIEKKNLWQQDTKKTHTNSNRLLYADYVRYVTKMKVNKPYYCGTHFGANLNSLVFIFTRAEAFVRRKAIRQTWGTPFSNKCLKSKFIFILGSSDNQTIEKLIQDEDKKYGDILHWDFIDNYYNCTLKVIGILRWTLFHCNQVPFILKMDDDMLLNAVSMDKFCEENRQAEKTLYGIMVKGWNPLRDKTSKWYISEQEYPATFYPPFINGPYLITGDSVFSLYTEIIQSLPALAFDDVYVTGIIAQKCKLNKTQMKQFIRLDMNGLSVENITTNIFRENFLFGHDFNEHDLHLVWNKTSF